MSTERQQLETTIAGLEAQRTLLGDAMVDAALVPLRAKLASLVAVPTVEPPTQTLKLVSILFLDIVGSTTLSQRLDPEAISAVMDGALAQFAAIVAQHGGKVLKYAGDSMLAVFGAEESREDDPERAVRAGLDLLEEGRYQREQIRQEHTHEGFDVRVGVHTGGVLLGGGVDTKDSIRGLAVNIAARMEQTAPPGGMRISHDTYRHVRGVFTVDLQPPLFVKGLDEPVTTYLVVCAKPRAFRVTTRGIEGVETRMIGRDAELEQLQDIALRLYGGRKMDAVTVVADAGIGKSRLLYEFQNWIETRPERFKIYQGRANPQMQRQPYGLLRDILAWRLQIADNDSMAAAKEKIEHGIAPLFTADAGEDMAQAHAHLLGHLIGLDFSDSRHVKGILDDGTQIRNRGFHAAAQMFRRVSASDGTPVVLLLDDVHWADEGSLDFLNYLMEVNRDVPMLVLSLTRPILFERRSDWNRAGIQRRIDLRPLGQGSSRLLANELMKKLAKIPEALHELIIGGAEGNPFYMEELIKMLVDQGAIETREDRWTVHPAKLLATRVPQTLTGVLQARLDSLKASEKLALQQASVIGLVFWDQALAAIDARATGALPGVTRRELVVPHKSDGLDGVREYAFKHQILHHVTYDTVLKSMRRECHARTAAWLTGLTGARASDFLGVTAEHFEKAGDGVKACEYFTRASEHAARRHAHEAAIGYVAQALPLIGEDEGRDPLVLRWRLLDVRERALDLQGKRLAQQADIDELQQLAEKLADDARRGEVAWRRCDLALRISDTRTMESYARQAMALAERAGAVELRLRAQQRLALARCLLGDPAAGRALAQSGLAEARAQGLRRIEARFLNALAYIAADDDLIVFLETNQQELAIDRELGDRRSEADTVGNLGYAWLAVGELAQARRFAEEGLQLVRDVGNRASEPYMLTTLSELALWQGNPALALAHARSALEVATSVEDPGKEAHALMSLGDAELALGNHEAAAAAFARIRATAEARDSPQRYAAAAGLARVAQAQGDLAKSLLALDNVLAHLAGGGTLEGMDTALSIRLTCFQVLECAGDPRATEVLATAHDELQLRADAITDLTLRQGYLENIPHHRAIVSAWLARNVEAPAR